VHSDVIDGAYSNRVPMNSDSTNAANCVDYADLLQSVQIHYLRAGVIERTRRRRQNLQSFEVHRRLPNAFPCMPCH